MTHHGPPPLAGLALAALAAAGCGRGGLAPIEAERPLLELLAHPELRTVVREDAARPVEQDLVMPRGSGSDDYGAYPALRLAPPAEVAWIVPPTDPSARLRFAIGIERRGYQGSGSMRFELLLDGRSIFDETLPCGGDLAREERRWHRFELPIGAGGELRARTSYSGDQPEPPVAALGLLRIVIPFEVERRRARPGEPNVVLVLVDTLRADRLSIYGNPAPVSPAIDALARAGTRFERAYSSAAWTIPSTASVLTGASPPEHGLGLADSYYLADSLVTIAEAFQLAGFTTGGFACNPLIARSRNFAQGFESFRDYRWPRGEAIASDVEAWLGEHAGERFFLYVHLVDPHFPYEPTEDEKQGIVGPEPPNYVAGELDRYLEEFYADPKADLAALVASKDHQLELYDAEILGADRTIARIVDKLRALGLERDTVVAVTSDHGEEFLEHGWAGHHNQLFDETVHVPLVLAGPGVPRGATASAPVENRRIAPTLLRLAGLDPPANLAGPSLLDRDLLDPLRATGAESAPVFFTNSKGRWADLARRHVERLGQIHGVIADGWRLIWSPGGPLADANDPASGTGELVALYDLARDPECRVDRSAEEPERVQRMKELVQAWIAEGSERRPRGLPADGATLEMLRGIGYVEGGD